MNQFHLTLAGLKESPGQFKLTVWAASQQCRLRLHEHLERLRHLHALSDLGLNSEYRDRVSQEVLGIGGIPRLMRTSAFPSEPKRYSDLTDMEKDQIRKARLQCTLRAKVENSDELDSLFVPGSWICTQCDNVNIPGALVCVNFTTSEEGIPGGPKETVYVQCTGSQMHTWGGYVRVADVKPLLSMREVDPNWRGKFQSGSRSQRKCNRRCSH